MRSPLMRALGCFALYLVFVMGYTVVASTLADLLQETYPVYGGSMFFLCVTYLGCSYLPLSLKGYITPGIGFAALFGGALSVVLALCMLGGEPLFAPALCFLPTLMLAVSIMLPNRKKLPSPARGRGPG